MMFPKNETMQIDAKSTRAREGNRNRGRYLNPVLGLRASNKTHGQPNLHDRILPLWFSCIPSHNLAVRVESHTLSQRDGPQQPRQPGGLIHALFGDVGYSLTP
jgi:hypothetical protein